MQQLIGGSSRQTDVDVALPLIRCVFSFMDER